MGQFQNGSELAVIRGRSRMGHLKLDPQVKVLESDCRVLVAGPKTLSVSSEYASKVKIAHIGVIRETSILNTFHLYVPADQVHLGVDQMNDFIRKHVEKELEQMKADVARAEEWLNG